MARDVLERYDGGSQVIETGDPLIDGLNAALTDLDGTSVLINIEVEFQATGPLTTYRGVTLVAPAILSLIACVEATGVDLFPYVISSYRSREQQAALYAAFLAGTGNLAAAPGSSNHETGTAMDLSSTFQYAHPEVRGWLLSHGWVADVPSEYWHLHWIGG